MGEREKGEWGMEERVWREIGRGNDNARVERRTRNYEYILHNFLSLYQWLILKKCTIFT